ncbi:MAG: HDIG domain-containing protein, partial [Flavobacteriales bacterium]|nr:HDIG domain-containing protein [Flavobacteriales bacterium]
AAAFLLTLLVIFIFLPKAGLFKYEYQLNQPWKHDKLFAPFDFGIRKMADELSTEKEQIQESQFPVFSLDPTMGDAILDKMLRDWDAVDWDSSANCDSLRDPSFEYAMFTVSKGIIKQDDHLKNASPFQKIFLHQNGELQTKELKDIQNIQLAVDSIRAWIQGNVDSICQENVAAVLIENLTPNLIFNDSLTTKLLLASYDEIITVEGKINRGQAIIDKGDLVDEKAYRILESLKAEYSERTISETGFQWSLVGEMGVVVVLLGLLMLFVYLSQDRMFNDPRPVTLSLTLLSVCFIMTSLAYSSDTISVYAIPIGIAPLLLRMFYDFRISLFSFLIIALIVALFSKKPLEFTIVQVSAISFATLYQASSTRRSRMLATALVVFVGYSGIYTFMTVAQNGSIGAIDPAYFGWFAINSLLCTLVFPLIYLVEKVFGYISETTLLELGDSNQPLLKELAIKAPGTFQHSLQVANLAEKIASKIGGNSVLLRTAAMYHDIGKMNEPQFFIENQLPENNPHDDLEPKESAAIIIAHVTQGIEKARDQNIPLDIVQFIQTHHGTSTVQYFMKRALEKDPNMDRTRFTYPGPKPQTKEQAILMMADSVEAASRSLKKYDHEALESLVDNIVEYQRGEGQFEESPLTFKDINTAKDVLKTALKGIFHQRISYD